MKAKKSILTLEQFRVIKSSIDFIPFEEDYPQDIAEYMGNMPIDIDFDILTRPNDDADKELYMISVKIVINEDKLEGYNILVEGGGLFSFPKNSKLNDQEKSDWILSGVNISITSLRSYITMITSFSPLGHYVLPAIDMSDLIKQKKNKEQ